MIKQVVSKVTEALVCILSVFILGMAFPMLITLVVVMFTDTLWSECFGQPFWIGTVIGWFFSVFYVAYVYDNVLYEDQVSNL